MPGSEANARVVRPASHHAGAFNLGWKVLLALAILLLMSAGIALPLPFLWAFTWIVLLLWGGLVTGVAAVNLLHGIPGHRWLWVALAVGAYAALAVPAIVRMPMGQTASASDLSVLPLKLVDALGPVIALTLAAHLPRRDLQRAFQDWAMLIALCLYTSLGVAAMAQLVVSFGIIIFLLVVLLPPLLAEAALLLLRRNELLRGSFAAHLAAIALVAAIVALIFSLTLLNSSTPLLWTVVFDVVTGLVVAGALLLAYATRPLAEAAAGVGKSSSGSAARALVELSHSSILIALLAYLLVRLFAGSVAG